MKKVDFNFQIFLILLNLIVSSVDATYLTSATWRRTIVMEKKVVVQLVSSTSLIIIICLLHWLHSQCLQLVTTGKRRTVLVWPRPSTPCPPCPRWRRPLSTTALTGGRLSTISTLRIKMVSLRNLQDSCQSFLERHFQSY